jgi:hypothetical protein
MKFFFGQGKNEVYISVKKIMVGKGIIFTFIGSNFYLFLCNYK